jgi:nucleotide-binding universal stress UspA family protein
LAAAAEIAARHPHAAARVVFCRPLLRGVEELEEAPQLPPGAEFATIERLPDDGLVEEAERADLLLVGSRGLTGLRALGSTSERVAHQASSSVLLVRPTAAT